MQSGPCPPMGCQDGASAGPSEPRRRCSAISLVHGCAGSPRCPDPGQNLSPRASRPGLPPPGSPPHFSPFFFLASFFSSSSTLMATVSTLSFFFFFFLSSVG